MKRSSEDEINVIETGTIKIPVTEKYSFDSISHANIRTLEFWMFSKGSSKLPKNAQIPIV